MRATFILLSAGLHRLTKMLAVNPEPLKKTATRGGGHSTASADAYPHRLKLGLV
jgi:hypothetical protein